MVIRISGSVDGSAAISYIRRVVPSVNANIKTAVLSSAIDLRSYVILRKLSGDPLHHRSGNLIDNVKPPEITESSGIYRARLFVGSGAPYGAVHEFGGVFTRLVSMAWGKPMKEPHNVTFHYPERSFMRSSLEEERAVILARIEEAINAGLRV